MIGRAWRSGRRMRLFCGVCAALRLSQAFGFGLAKRVRGERESLSLFFHNGSASWLTYEIAAAAAAAAAVPNTMSPSSSFLQLYSYSGGAVMKSNENSLNALFSFSIIHMTDDFIDLFSPPSASVFLSFPTLRQRRRDTLACHRKSPIIADSIGPGLQSRVFLQKRWKLTLLSGALFRVGRVGQWGSWVTPDQAKQMLHRQRERRGMILIELFDSFDADDIREMNGHADDEIKRQRLHYGSDQLYSVSFRNLTANGSYLQIVIV